MPPRRSPAPLWFVLALQLALWLVLRLCDVELAGPVDPHTGEPVRLAFWGIVIMVAQAIWTGVQAAATATVQFLVWAMHAVWASLVTIFNALREVGSAFLKFGKWSFDFLKRTYEHVIKPAWKHLWKWFNRAKKWLDDFVRPAFEFLAWVKKNVLDFYNEYVRPILDVIGIARRALRILGSFGLDWARALDRKLGDIEELIDRPFRIVLAKINEVVGVLNRIVTADGLIQRIAMLKSIERDIRQVSAAFANWRDRPLVESDWKRIRGRAAERTEQQVQGDFIAAVGRGEGRHRAMIAELAKQWETRIERGY